MAQPNPNQANVIIENATITIPLKYLSNFWRSLEMSLISCKFQSKLRWTKHCVLSMLGVANGDNGDDANSKVLFLL